ncbi:MAG: ATPase, T2SS/T4P/T4SS family [Thaumarchaeota archaeon]|nr:ATPase, T2SS/T4P/T4SS family [Nitrososphaerota archaeon]
MEGFFWGLLLRIARKKDVARAGQPLLIELLQEVDGEELESYSVPPFKYTVKRASGKINYQVLPEISVAELGFLREAVLEMSTSFKVSSVSPLTFARLIEVLCQAGVARLAPLREAGRVRALSRLAAFEAVGIPTVYAFALDRAVTEFYVDATNTPVYLDHTKHGRCETQVTLTERERKAIETHMDTFKGYTMDFSNPSLKNEFDIFGNRLRISLDLAPLAVNSFSLDVRKLTSNDLTVPDLVAMDVISSECAAFLLAGLELGMNVTIIGETGTGKTTLLNALDEALNPRLRRIYVEDAVETKDLLGKGYHQMKLRVDPFERGAESSRTKSEEITKILHRSPDLVVLGEIQSEEHSRAFFHALTAGVRGLQTFHASSPGQAVRRWREMHGISKTSLLDLDIIVQMSRPDKLGSRRRVHGVVMVVEEEGEPRLREVYARGRGALLHRIMPWERLQIRRPSLTNETFLEKLELVQGSLEVQEVRLSR